MLMDDGSDDHAIEQVVIIDPGQYLVLARSGDPEVNHGLEPDYVYSGFNLSNVDDELVLACGQVEIDRVVYNGSVVVEGVAAQLEATLLSGEANDELLNWCPAAKEYGTAGKLGTPGTKNAVCPVAGPCDPNPCTEAPPSICEDGLIWTKYLLPGECTNINGQAFCTFFEVSLNCANEGKICVDGACVFP